MAAFIAKQVVGDKLSSVKGAIGKDEEGGTNEKDDEAAREIEEARREMEEKRKEKHRKMEEERETMRQGIRDKVHQEHNENVMATEEKKLKYGLKKKEEPHEEEVDPMAEGRVGRKKKTPAELAAEANKEESDDEEFAKFPPNLSELSSKVSELPAKMVQGVGEITQKCVLQ